MGFVLDTSTGSAALKVHYTKKKIEDLVYASPALGLMPKFTGGSGSSYNGAIRSAIVASVSADDTKAFTAGGSSVYAQWVCPWKYGYASANVSGAMIDQTSNEAGAFIRALTSETDSAFKAIAQHLGKALWGNGGGAIGQISSTSNVGSTVITLAQPADAVNFWQGQILNAATTDGTSGSVETGSVTITKVNTVTGQLTASGNWSTGISTIATLDYLFLQGDFGAKMQGIPAWIPTTDPTGTFNGVDRTPDILRYSGTRFFGNGATKEESMIRTGTLVQRAGGRPTHFFVNPLDYSDIVQDLGTKVIYTSEKSFGNAQIAFDAVSMATPFGTVKLVQDPFVPVGAGWMLDLQTWLVASIGALPRVDLADKLSWLRNTGADSYQFRVLYRAATYCSNPGHNAVCVF